MSNKYLAKAAELAPIIERVHGANHPELTRVREITEQLVKGDPADAGALYRELRLVTGAYAIPADVCETFEATYKLLERSERAAALV